MAFDTINADNGKSESFSSLDDAVHFGEQYLIRYQVKENGVMVPDEAVFAAKRRIQHLCG